MKRILPILSIALILAAFGLIERSYPQKSEGSVKKKNELARPIALKGGFFEASGVALAEGTNSVLFVDDSRPGEVFWMHFDGNAQQLGPIIPIPLGVQIEDPEGITFDGKFYYIIGSQSRPRSGRRTGLVRFRFDPATKQVHAVAALAGIREFLLKNVTGLPAQALRNGLNIEGIAWDPFQQSLLMGLRSPLLNKEAILIRLQFRDAEGPFSLENFTIAPPIFVPFGGAGIRDLGYDAQTEKLLIISGATETHGNKPPYLWSWKNGVLERLAQLNANTKPEGIVRLNRESLLIVCDGSAYFILNDPPGQ